MDISVTIGSLTKTIEVADDQFTNNPSYVVESAKVLTREAVLEYIHSLDFSE